ncbi:hypothetical protein TREMEDRAFT_71110 [Tremella mesenterica DSM 1558]|uniref:uncharacterized protein n=1 Tax=Tremella mesenterica (strain ATCC 24925 / CBS 8224 / DSM 1558 / NBRC 9311 / NRRL Y-6157 / RJB 2259-6 / UBC 559-6) TaxID=578456 RepID=UPI0003F49FE2|nr:uncharacterized protein TREMEDRAFT_71110 [Tremella mesenterica DSM 1558]EIW71272.1 hypothetical protein TREMEDRAFT_71110 [Tremella mesenterica DSM 1558]
MDFFSPSLTASSSTTSAVSQSSPPNQPDNMDDPMSPLDFFNFSSFDENETENEASTTAHSPTTISPNHTPSPLPGTFSPLVVAGTGEYEDFDFDMGLGKLVDMNTTEHIPLIKTEPIDHTWTVGSISDSPVATQPMALAVPQVETEPIISVPADLPLDRLTPEQQLLFSQVFLNALTTYAKTISKTTGDTVSPPMTVNPAMLSSSSSFDPQFPLSINASSSSSVSPSINDQPSSASLLSAPILAPMPSPRAGPSRLEPSPSGEPRDYHREASPPLREVRQGSTFSSIEDIEAKIDRLMPSSDIFNSGRGKGGKKGGGVSSVVRADDEELNDDDSWRPSKEEYEKLGSKEKRQLRNKLSARAFRNRKNEYVGRLETHLRDRDAIIEDMRAELVNSKTENMDLRRELEALKQSTMTILHPESAQELTPVPPLMAAFAKTPLPLSSSGHVPKRTSTPTINTRKDLSSSARGFWGGAESNMFGGGSTICHHLFTPDLVLPESDMSAGTPAAFTSSKSKTPLKSMVDMPRINLNPALDVADVRGFDLRGLGKGGDLTTTFHEWTEDNAFSLRSLNDYNEQLWRRSVREAAHEKANVPLHLRPKFYVEEKVSSRPSTPSQSGRSSPTSTKSVAGKIASSFWTTFEGPKNTESLTAYVTGATRLKNLPKVEEFNEKASLVGSTKAKEASAAADALSAAMGSLKLVTGTGGRLDNFSARENPLGTLSTFFKHAATPTRA